MDFTGARNDGMAVASAGPYESFAPRCRQITTPVPHHSFFTSWMPFLPPNQQCQSTEGTRRVPCTRRVQFFRAKKGAGTGHDLTCPAVDILRATQQGAARVRCKYFVDTDSGILEGVHIGAIWRIPLNRPCGVAMRPYIKLL